ncbi:MAG: Gfo/Idh/MocA family oxidoreductase [Bacteroidales bacterium]|nr:Gfo/Idh/MocA family oxidoreductase [Bacteroidales bacterium]
MKSRLLRIFALAVIAIAGLTGCSGAGQGHDGYRIVDGTIVFNVPDRAPGQESVLGLTTDPMEVVRVGFVGLGMRGPDAVNRMTYIDGVEIKALCDLLPERVEKAQKILADRGFPEADGYSGEEGYKELCERDDIDLVYIATGWQKHVPIAVYAMQHGKHVAVEVPAATSVEECWQLVDVAEQTQRHCMMLENCVYDFFEMTTLNMAQHGLFGEIEHVEGAYLHNLDPFWDRYQDNWRLEFNQAHRGDVYPTHGLGPACQLLDIHRGDRMTRLVSMDTPSINGAAKARESMGTDSFANGDHTMTMIQTYKGRTILLKHGVYTPRPYSREYQVTGTEGYANKYPIAGFAFRPESFTESEPDYQKLDDDEFVPREVRDALMEQYKDPIVKEIEDKAKEIGGHGGMDFIMDYRLIYCLRNGLPLDEDVYDAAEWSCIGGLSAASLENGNLPVEFPDFTRGDWNKVQGYRHAVK